MYNTKLLYWLLGLNLWEPTRLQMINWFCASVLLSVGEFGSAPQTPGGNESQLA